MDKNTITGMVNSLLNSSIMILLLKCSNVPQNYKQRQKQHLPMNVLLLQKTLLHCFLVPHKVQQSW